MELHEEATNGNSQAHDLLNHMQTYGFIALTYALSDILPVINRLNLCFQKEDVNLSSIDPLVQASLSASLLVLN